MDNLKNFSELMVLLFLYFFIWQAATEANLLFRLALTAAVALASSTALVKFVQLFMSNSLKDTIGVFKRNFLLFLFSLFGLAVAGLNFIPEMEQFRELYYYVLSVMVVALMINLMIEFKMIGKFDVRTGKGVVKNEQYN